MGSTARSPRVRARVTPHRGQGESLVPLYTRESVSLSLSLSLVVGPLAKQINIVLLNTHMSLNLIVVCKQRGCSNPNTRVRFRVECHDTKYKIRFGICNIVIHFNIKNGLDVKVVLLNVKVSRPS
jgi:hypothetical protein